MCVCVCGTCVYAFFMADLCDPLQYFEPDLAAACGTCIVLSGGTTKKKYNNKYKKNNNNNATACCSFLLLRRDAATRLRSCLIISLRSIEIARSPWSRLWLWFSGCFWPARKKLKRAKKTLKLEKFIKIPSEQRKS